MPTPPVSNERVAATLAAYLANDKNQSATAKAEGISRESVQRHIRLAAERGLLGYEPVQEGFAVKSISSKVGEAWIKQVKEHGDDYSVPEGHSVKGESALVDAEGRIIQKWVKTKNEYQTEGLMEAITKAFAEYAGLRILPDYPEFTNTDILVVYPIVDLHLGLYAWKPETGSDYDLKIAAGLLRSAVSTLVARSANAETAIILDLGDYFHADDSRNQTKRSGNPLDVDSRYARVLQVGVELVVDCIELALQKHAHVTYRKLPGNHDDETSLMLAIAIAAHFRNEPRVTVDTDPSRFFMRRFGKVMLAATHGDMLRMNDMAGFMAANWPKEWGATEFRYAYTGHVHHDRLKSGGGVRAESFNTLAAKDAWHAASGYVSPRSAVSITMHRDQGEIDRLTVNLPMARVAANDNEPMAAAA